MKRFFCLILTALVLLAPCAVSAAEPLDGQTAAENLHALGLLAGVGNNADGSVNFAVDGKLTRAQSITQVVRFLGAEKTATAETNDHPFTDLPQWAAPYVSYAYANGITKGVSATKFGTDDQMADASFLTLILRVLGYDDGAGDFVWNNPYTLAKTVGLIDSETPDADFTRGDAFVICYRALTATVKSGSSVKDQLVAKGIFTAADFDEVSGAVLEPMIPVEPETVLRSIKELNTEAVEGSHAGDDFITASMEVNYRETLKLNSNTAGHYRFDTAFYPRVKKINESLYLMFFMQGQTGPNLFWTTSADGVSWNTPEVLYNIADHVITHKDGPLAGTEDKLLAANADAVLLDNGEILCTYYVRPSAGYQKYPALSGLYTVRGTVTEDDTVTWGEHRKISAGQGWEPFIWQREDGVIEIYWSSPVAYLNTYGYDNDMRSAGVLMIRSFDNGFTWTPDIREDAAGNYEALRVFNQYLGDRVPNVADKEYTEAVPYFGGQMPAVVRLVNGRLLMAAEVRILDRSFTIATQLSDENGAWKVHAVTEGTSNSDWQDNFAGMAPYLVRFPSGEVLLTYTRSRASYYRMVSPDGTAVDTKELSAVADSYGEWGAAELVSGHEVILVEENRGDMATSVVMTHAYLNHRINAKAVAVSVDGYTNEWKDNTDALFVGSETQAQITLQTAHDGENVYFLINRLDEYLTDGDTVTVNIGVGKTDYYRVAVGLDGVRTVAFVKGGAETQLFADGVKAAVKTFGTVGNAEDKDEGAVIEIALPKALVGITGAASFAVSPVLANQDGVGSVSDTLSGVSPFVTDRWPAVVLD